jgi:hypothetical protein
MANQEQTQNIQPRMRKQGLMPMHRPLGRWLIQISSRLFYFFVLFKDCLLFELSFNWL